MSYTTLLGVKNDGCVETIEELRNGHGAGPFVWSAIERLHGIKSWIICSEEDAWINCRYLPRCSEPEAWALAMTFDSIIVKREDAAYIVEQLKVFFERVAVAGINERSVNHWPAIIKTMGELPPEYTGLAINHTSVFDGPLLSGVYVGENELDDDENDENWEDHHRPYNINEDSDHLFLTQELMTKWMSTEKDGAANDG